MNEQQFLDKIEEMRQQGLCSTSLESAKRYAAELRAGSGLSLTLAEDELRICEPGMGILDLNTPEQLEKLDLWQGVTQLSDRERASIKLFLKMHGITPMNKRAALQTELAKEEAKEAERTSNRETVDSTGNITRREEPPLSLYGLLVALRQSTKNRRNGVGEPTYTLLMRALLLNDNYFWSSDSTERHLRRWGGNYYEYAQVILANAHNEQRRELVKKKMLEALQKMENENETEGPELRLDVARACFNLEQDMERWRMKHENPDEEWGCYEGSETQLVLQQLASMHKGTISHIYKNISDDDLAELVVNLFSLAIDASEGRFPPAPEPEDRLAKLSPAERALLAVVTCGLPMKKKHWTMEQIQPMLMNILLAGVLVPEQGVGRFDQLILAKGIEPIYTTKAMEPLSWERVFHDERILCDKTEYLSLADLLNAEELTGKNREVIWKLLKQLLMKNDAEDIDEQLQWSLTEQLERVLERVRGEEEMTVLEFLVRCHWRRINSEEDLVAIESLDKLLFWMELYPGEMEKIWSKILPGTTVERKAEALYRTGGSLIHAELQATCARRCLSRATADLKVQRYWASSAILQAEKALVQLRKLYSPTLASQAARTKAMGYALLGNRPECEAALDEAKQWSEKSQYEFILDGDPVGKTMEACEQQLSQKEELHAADPQFYGWFTQERRYDMTLVKEIVMRALGIVQLTESSLLLCMQVWEQIPPGSRIAGWERLAEWMNEIDTMKHSEPQMDPDLICNYLIDKSVNDYGVLGMVNSLGLRDLTTMLSRKDM